MKNKHGLFSKKEWAGIGIGLAACLFFAMFCSSCGCGGSGGSVNALRVLNGFRDYLGGILFSFGK